MDVLGCLGCDLLAGRRELPGGTVHDTKPWVINHAVGSMNLETLVLSPRQHIVAVADLPDQAVEELGSLLKQTAQILEASLKPEQAYVASWAHRHEGRKHLHILVQPVTTETVREYGGALSAQLQAKMLLSDEEPAREDVEWFCGRARHLFRARRSAEGEQHPDAVVVSKRHRTSKPDPPDAAKGRPTVETPDANLVRSPHRWRGRALQKWLV